MSKQAKRYEEVMEQEREERSIFDLLDEAYELERQDMQRKMIYINNRNSRIFTAEANMRSAIEYGYLAS